MELWIRGPLIFQSVMVKFHDQKKCTFNNEIEKRSSMVEACSVNFPQTLCCFESSDVAGWHPCEIVCLDPTARSSTKVQLLFEIWSVLGILSAVHLPRNLRPQFPRLCMAYCDLASSSESFLCLPSNDSTCHQISLLWIDPAVPALCRS